MQLLGPVRLAGASGEVPLARPLSRVLLAALAVSANRVVSAGALINTLWQEDATDRRERNLHAQVYQLRRRLAVAEPSGDTRLVRDAHGYRLALGHDELDTAVFSELASRGRRMAAEGRAAEAAEVLGQALRLWRGQALEDVSPLSMPLADEASVIEDVRAAVAEDWANCLLAAGRHSEMLTVLSALAGQFPFRERLVAQLMTAMHRSGRRAEALAVFDRTRGLLRTELGVDPGQELADLHVRMLRDDPALATAPVNAAASADVASAGRVTDNSRVDIGTDQSGRVAVDARAGMPVPRQLPNAVPRFVGRAAELKELDGLLEELAGPAFPGEAGRPVTAAIVGMGGVGKTALAVHWAHTVADRFPDGQLYAYLGDDSSEPSAGPANASGWLLASLVTEPSQIPADPRAQAGLYRSLLADRRILIVLDNAQSAAQIRPLLAGGPGSMVLVTSRFSLTGLAASDEARLIHLDPLEPESASQMLAARIGPERAEAEPDARAELILACSGLPLALAIVGARVASSPYLSLGALAAQLMDDLERLDVLDTGDPATSIRAVFSWSVDRLSDASRRMFILLHLHPGPDFTLPAAASLAATTPAAARPAIAELAGSNLLTEHRPGRFLLHDLLSSYAADRAKDALAETELTAAARRGIDHYVQTAAAAPWAYPIRTVASREPGVLPEPLADEAQAMVWLRAEQHVLLYAVSHAAAGGMTQASWQIFVLLAVMLAQEGRWVDWAAAGQVALRAATRAGDHEGLSRVHRSLAMRAQMLGSREELDIHNRKALEHSAKAGDVRAEAHAHLTIAQSIQLASGGIANLSDQAGEPDGDAFTHAQQAADLFRQAADQHGEGLALTALADAYSRMSMHAEATKACQRAVDLQKAAGNAMGQAHAWHVLGLAHRRHGDLAEAVRCYQLALDLRIEMSPFQHWYRALINTHIGDAHWASGQQRAARTAWHSAVRTLDGLHHPDAAAVRDRLARSVRPNPEQR